MIFTIASVSSTSAGWNERTAQQAVADTINARCRLVMRVEPITALLGLGVGIQNGLCGTAHIRLGDAHGADRVVVGTGSQSAFNADPRSIDQRWSGDLIDQRQHPTRAVRRQEKSGQRGRRGLDRRRLDGLSPYPPLIQ